MYLALVIRRKLCNLKHLLLGDELQKKFLSLRYYCILNAFSLQVGFNANGKILALEASFYSNAGCSLDLSQNVMQKALLSASGPYHIPNVKLTGYTCKTNLPSNTAFRGFGLPQV